MDTDETMVEELLDATGAVRRFRLSVYCLGQFLEAVELKDGEDRGLRFVLPVPADGSVPWGEMRLALREWLARRDVVYDRRTERLEMLTRSLRGQIAMAGDEEIGPRILVDDLQLQWEDLGRLLESFEGFHLRLEIRDPSDAF